MRIIGIYIKEKTSEQVRKNLAPGWYPFCSAFTTPIRDFEDYGKAESIERIDNSIYSQQNRFLPTDINICAVVGRNGSGKSTLLEMIYRILNNLAYVLMLHRDGANNDLSYAHGVYADLYYDLGGVKRLCKIEVRGPECKFYYGFGKEGVWVEKPLNTGHTPDDEFIDHRFFPNIYKELFYTISVNYSIYSLNKEDFDPYNPFEEYDAEINGDWLNGIFHKNDGYLAPITLAPFRKNGIIDIAREKRLANQRVTALSLLFYSQRKVFLEGYTPRRLMYSFDYEFENKSRKKLYEDYGRAGWTENEVNEVLAVITGYWKNQPEIASDIESIAAVDSPAYNIIYYYLAVKTFKICTTYSSFQGVYDPNDFKGKCTSNNKNEHLEKIGAAVDKMLRKDERTHITLKLRQCLRWISNKDYSIWSKEEKDGGKDFIKCFDRFRKNVRLRTYDDAILLMPPSFFQYELRFYPYSKRQILKYIDEKKKEISLSRMSSGEIQFLFSLSYVLYHIKNLMSVKGDNYREEYNHVTIILDEAELYYHPDYQRRYVDMLLERLGNAHFDKRKLKSINIIIATHSPFILSDIQGQNILYLKEGKRMNIDKQTFGANLYELMKNSFFFDKNSLGTVAASYTRNILNRANEGHFPTAQEEELIGDRNILRYLYYLKEKDYVQDNKE